VEVDTKEADFIFSDEMLPHMKAFLEKEVGPDSIAEYLIEECIRKQKIAKRLGRTAIRHDPLAIRLGIIIRNKMGYHGGLYDLLAKIAGLPCDRTLSQYKVPNSNDPDGFMYGTVMNEKNKFDRLFPNAKRKAWQRHVTLAFDSMSCKGR
jgi:hypothetical protein